tara:strand:- start:153 stop:506 length:354 start_codon:yes stop_codon:yes gene_type:complete
MAMDRTTHHRLFARLLTVAWIAGLVIAGVQSAPMSLEMALAGTATAEKACTACDDAGEPTGVATCQVPCISAPAVLANRLLQGPTVLAVTRISITHRAVSGLQPIPEPAPPKHSAHS